MNWTALAVALLLFTLAGIARTGARWVFLAAAIVHVGIAFERPAHIFYLNARAGCWPWSPAEVEYRPGMTLCPGQAARGVFTLPFPAPHSGVFRPFEPPPEREI